MTEHPRFRSTYLASDYVSHANGEMSRNEMIEALADHLVEETIGLVVDRCREDALALRRPGEIAQFAAEFAAHRLIDLADFELGSWSAVMGDLPRERAEHR